MLCPHCRLEARRFGFAESGSQRYQCLRCAKTFTDETTRAIDRRFVSPEKMVFCLRMLLEGTSIRAVERLTGVNRNTIMNTMVDIGAKCKLFLEETIRGISVVTIEADEVWGFVRCKEKTRFLRNYPEDGYGDAYCFTAVERSTKLLVAWHLGKRSVEDTYDFAAKLRRATVGKFQLTTDGWISYRAAIPATFSPTLDFAVLIKNYHATPEDQRRYSPPEIIAIKIKIQSGQPDEDKISTSFVERSNRTLRMQIRRLTRLTDAHSKKWENHEAALAMFFAFYNFCRVHSTLKSTPARAAGLTTEDWSVERLLQEIERVPR